MGTSWHPQLWSPPSATSCFPFARFAFSANTQQAKETSGRHWESVLSAGSETPSNLQLLSQLPSKSPMKMSSKKPRVTANTALLQAQCTHATALQCPGDCKVLGIAGTLLYCTATIVSIHEPFFPRKQHLPKSCTAAPAPGQCSTGLCSTERVETLLQMKLNPKPPAVTLAGFAWVP